MRERLRAVGGVILLATMAAGILSACGGDECLGSGENCTQAYKQSQYGRTTIQCCAGTCESGLENGVLVCRGG